MINQYRLKLKVLKEKDMVYFSQLDIYRLFIRALRRAHLPLFYTSGFNPHPKISFNQALKLGKEGVFETVFYFNKKIKPKEFIKKFSMQIPKNLKIITVESL